MNVGCMILSHECTYDVWHCMKRFKEGDVDMCFYK